MPKHRYRYQGTDSFNQVWYQIGGIVGTLFFTIFGSVFFLGALYVSNSEKSLSLKEDPRVTLICFGIIFIVISWIIGSKFINFLPDIWLDTDGITISNFIIFRYFIPWSEIIDIGEGHPPRGYILVRVKRITVFHRFFGWDYSKTLLPSFLIGQGIENREYLFEEIRRNIAYSTSIKY